MRGVVTLVLQGLTLPPLIRALGLANTYENNCEESEARRIITTTALAHLQEVRPREGDDFASVYDDIARSYARRLASFPDQHSDAEPRSNEELNRYRQAIGELLRIERKTAVSLRNEGRINDEVLRKIEHELDLSETRLALS